MPEAIIAVTKMGNKFPVFGTMFFVISKILFQVMHQGQVAMILIDQAKGCIEIVLVSHGIAEGVQITKQDVSYILFVKLFSSVCFVLYIQQSLNRIFTKQQQFRILQ